MELGPEDVSLLERCPHFRGCYVQASMELGPEDVSLLERCPHFRGCYVQASVAEDVSLLERCPHFTSSHCVFHSSVKKPKSLVEIQQEQQGDPGELTTPTSAGGRGSKGKAYFTFGTPVRGVSWESGVHSSSYTNHMVS